MSFPTLLRRTLPRAGSGHHLLSAAGIAGLLLGLFAGTPAARAQQLIVDNARGGYAVTADATFSVIYVGYGQDFSPGSMSQSAFTLTVGAFHLAFGANGNYTLGGTGVLQATTEDMGADASFAEFDQNGGTNSVSDTMGIGSFQGPAVYNLNAGTLAVGGVETLDHGFFTQTGGTHIAQSIIFDALTTMLTGSDNYTLSGGTLQTSSIRALAGSVNAEFDFNGGTLLPTGNNTNFLSGMTTAKVMSGGAIFDTAGFNIAVSQTLVAGGGGLTKKGAGTLTLTGANTYTGPTVISGGTLQAGTLANGGATSALGAASNAAGNLVLDGGTLQYAGSTAVSTDRLFTVSGNGGTLDASGSGTLTLAGNTAGGANAVAYATANVAAAVTLTGTTTGALGISVTDNGTGPTALTKSGAGAWTLSGTNSYTGATAINAGTLQFAKVAALANTTGTTTVNATTANFLVAGGATAAFNTGGTGEFTPAQIAALAALGSASGGFQSGSALGVDTSNAPAPVVLGSALANPNGGANSLRLVKLGTGTLTLTGNNLYDGGTAFNGGILNAGSAGALGAAGPLSFGGGTLQYSTSNQTDYSARFSTAAGQAFNIDTNGQNVTLGSALTSTGGKFNKLGAGTLTLTGNNLYDGGTAFNGGTLNAGSAGALGAAGPLSFGGGTLQYSANNQTDYSARFSTAAGQPISIDTNGQTVTLGSALTSSGGTLTKSGAGLLALAGANTYTGVTTINAGVLSVTTLANGGVSSGLGSSSNAPGNLVLNGGTLQYAGTANASTDRRFTLGANGGTLDASGSGSLTIAGSGANTVAYVTANTATTLTLTGTGLGDVGTTIGNNGTGLTAVTKTGSGTWILNTPESYTGATTVSGGTLVLDGTSGTVLGSTSTIIVTNATPKLTGNQYNALIIPTLLTVGAGGFVDAANVGGTKNAHTLGATLLQGGTLMSSTAADPAFGNFVLNNNDTLTANGDVPSTINAFVFQLGGLNTNINVGTGTNGAASLLTISSQMPNFSSNTAVAALNKSGAGTLVLSGLNTYTGATTINAGTVQFAKTVSLDNTTSITTVNATTANFLVASGATAAFNVGGTGEFTTTQIAALAVLGTGAGGFESGSTIGIDTSNAPGAVSYSVALANPNGGANVLGLAKLGTGTFTLLAANTYTGATAVKGGKLIVSGALNGTASATVGDGINSATLGGTGTITPKNGGALTVMNAATLAPAIGTSGGLAINAATSGTAALTFQSGSTFQLSMANNQAVALGAPALGDYSKLTIGTGVSVTLGGNILTSFDGNLNNGNLFTIILNSGTLTGAFANTPTAAPNSTGSTFRFSSNGLLWDINYAWPGGTPLANQNVTSFEQTNTGHNVALLLVAVPESSTWVSLLGGAALLLGWRRRGWKR